MTQFDDTSAKSAKKWIIWLPWLLLVAVIATATFYITNIQSSSDKQALTHQNGTQDENPEKNQEQADNQAWQPPTTETTDAEDSNSTTSNATNNNHAPTIKSYHNAVAKAAQSVVNIYTTQKVKHPYMNDPLVQQFLEFYGDIPQQDSTNLGSGVIVSADGYIVTNAHVIEQADEITVSFNDGRSSQAKLIGKDPDSDLAVIKVEMTDLPPLTFRTEPTQVGDVTLAIGNPFGVGQTVTQGIISATGRTGLGVNTFEDFIQTDAAINPGNSGGALVDADGNLIGINTMIYSRSGGSMGIGFAIPTVIVEQVMNALIKYGHVKRGWLGIEVKNQLKDPTKLDTSTGVEVLNVIDGSPAAVSGLQVGDIIMSIDDKQMTDANTLVQYVARKLPNDSLEAEVMRAGESITLTINLAERPSQNALKAQASQNSNNDNVTPDSDPRANNPNGLNNPGQPNHSPNNSQESSGLSAEEMARLQRGLMELLDGR